MALKIMFVALIVLPVIILSLLFIAGPVLAAQPAVVPPAQVQQVNPQAAPTAVPAIEKLNASPFLLHLLP